MSTITGLKLAILNKHNLLKNNQYVHRTTIKTKMCLHHTSGRTAQSSIDWWNKEANRVSTAVMIPRNGEIWELFPTKFWAWALGKTKYGTALERESIQFEIANAGGLTKRNGKYYTWYHAEINEEDVVEYKEDHRGYKFYERYTDGQVEAIVFALGYYAELHKIKVDPVKLENFWWGSKEPEAIYAHTTVRKNKSDIHPQPNLIKAIYDHFGCTAAVTE